MGISRRDVFASLLGAGAASAAIGTVAASGQSNEPRVLSGADLGFRVEGTAQTVRRLGLLLCGSMENGLPSVSAGAAAAT